MFCLPSYIDSKSLRERGCQCEDVSIMITVENSTDIFVSLSPCFAVFLYSVSMDLNCVLFKRMNEWIRTDMAVVTKQVKLGLIL